MQNTRVPSHREQTRGSTRAFVAYTARVRARCAGTKRCGHAVRARNGAGRARAHCPKTAAPEVAAPQLVCWRGGGKWRGWNRRKLDALLSMPPGRSPPMHIRCTATAARRLPREPKSQLSPPARCAASSVLSCLARPRCRRNHGRRQANRVDALSTPSTAETDHISRFVEHRVRLRCPVRGRGACDRELVRTFNAAHWSPSPSPLRTGHCRPAQRSCDGIHAWHREFLWSEGGQRMSCGRH